jgi:hypothetical protein
MTSTPRGTASLGAGPDLRTAFAARGCEVSAWSVEELFARYRSAGFLYPAKLAMLAPVMAQVRSSWQRGLATGDDVIWFATCELDSGWATVAAWRTSFHGWQTQHLVSTSPRAARTVLLAAQAAHLGHETAAAMQNWFRSTNRFASAVFGTFADGRPTEDVCIVEHAFFALPLHVVAGAAAVTPARRVTDEVEASRVLDFVTEVRGPVFVAGEELRGDLELERLRPVYGAGLTRSRQVHVLEEAGVVLGAALCHRGPTGFSFSLLENRCDLVLRPGLPPDVASRTVRGLLVAAGPAYGTFSPGFVPVVVDPAWTMELLQVGAQPIRTYRQSIWLASAFADWYDHVDRIYERRLAGRTRSAS